MQNPTLKNVLKNVKKQQTTVKVIYHHVTQ